jgi:hypothetical protein
MFRSQFTGPTDPSFAVPAALSVRGCGKATATSRRIGRRGVPLDVDYFLDLIDPRVDREVED